MLADATNLGLDRMVHASSGVSHAQLSWAHPWYVRSETYAGVLARIIDAHRRAAARARVGQPRQDLIGRAVLPHRTQRRRDQRQVRPRPGPEDLFLPLGELWVVPLQCDRRHRGRSPLRARPTRALRRHRRCVRPCVRPVPSARPVVRPSAARLPRPEADLLRAARRSLRDHGSCRQRGGRARALERRVAVARWLRLDISRRPRPMSSSVPTRSSHCVPVAARVPCGFRSASR